MEIIIIIMLIIGYIFIEKNIGIIVENQKELEKEIKKNRK
jgi:hypothetical protein